MNPSVSPNSSIFDPPSNDILEYPASLTNKSNSNNGSDDKINYPAGSSNDMVHVQNKHTLVLILNLIDVRNTLIECERVLILQCTQFLPSKKIKLNDKLDYPQSSTARIIGSNFPYDNTNRHQLPINLPISSSSNDNILIQINELTTKWYGKHISDDEYLSEMTKIIKGGKH